MADSKRHARTLALVAGLGIAGLIAGLAMTGSVAAQELKTLRGRVGLEDINPAPEVLKQQMPGDGMFDRAYRQQPPLIPHRIDGYQITKDFNQCMTCHDWPANTKAGRAESVGDALQRPRGQPARQDLGHALLLHAVPCAADRRQAARHQHVPERLRSEVNRRATGREP